MLKLDNVRTIAGHQVHGDDDPAQAHVFYLMPRYPHLARLENGGLALRFVEYDAIRVDGDSQFGGFVAFDTDLSVDPATEAQVRAALQGELDDRFGAGVRTVQLQTVPWLSGAVKLLLQQDDKIVERVTGATAPSLTGFNTACFFVELSVLGTAIFKETLSKGTGSAIQVVYDLDHYVRLPQAKAWGRWHSDAFYSFYKEAHSDDHTYGNDKYTEITHSSRYLNEVTETHFEPVADPGLSAEDQADFDASIRDMIVKQLEDGVKRNIIAAAKDEDPSVEKLMDDEDYEDVSRWVTNYQSSDVEVSWDEAKAIVRRIHPQGMLPTVTSLKGADGAQLKWEDYYTKVSVDEFLRTLPVSVRVDADFADYGITLVEVKVRYPHGDNAKTVERTFTAADAGTPQKAEFIVADKIRDFWWSYTVHFEGDTDPWASVERKDDGTDLNVKVSGLPVLKLDVVNGDINFEQVAKARVRVRYDGGAAPVERFFNLTATDPPAGHRLLEFIGAPRTGDVVYQTTYTMKGDGREITGPELRTDADVVSIDDPFRSLRTVAFQAVGDLDADIDEITVQATYEEPGNGYQQSFNVTLSGEGKSFDNWTFATIDETQGRLSYLASTRHRDGTTTDVELADARGSRFQVGTKFAAKLDVTVVPDLLDWTRLKLVSVVVRYVGDGTAPVKQAPPMIFRPGDLDTKTWTVPLTDAALASYDATVTYFPLVGDRVTQTLTAQTEPLFLELPA